MLAHRERRLFTPEEYLAIEEKAETKSEYYRGEIYSMSGGSIEHGQISANLTHALVGALRGSGCQLLGADVRLSHGLGHDRGGGLCGGSSSAGSTLSRGLRGLGMGEPAQSAPDFSGRQLAPGVSEKVDFSAPTSLL